MALLASLSIKNELGQWEKYTISIRDDVDQFGNNVSVFKEQSKEQRDNKEKRIYLGNGKVFWTDGKPAIVAPKKQ